MFFLLPFAIIGASYLAGRGVSDLQVRHDKAMKKNRHEQPKSYGGGRYPWRPTPEELLELSKSKVT